jgi:hypothetical protein
MSARVLVIGGCCIALLAVPNPAFAARPVRLPSQCLRRSTEPAVAACLQPTFHRAAATGRVAATLDALEQAVRRGRLDDCHALAHELAHVVVARVRSVDRALGLGGSQCSDGYQHGVVEAATGVGAGPATCARRRSEELRDACHHALGHRYLIETRYDVRAALERCRARLRGQSAERCSDGVLMQNSMQFMRLGTALYTLHAPHACDGLHLSGRLQLTCYEEIGEVAMFVFRHRLSGARRVCARVVSAYGRRGCNAGARAELELTRSA